MRPVQRIISIGFATAAIAAGSMPALSGTVWPDVDFEWYANVGKGTSVTRPARQPGAPAETTYIAPSSTPQTMEIDGPAVVSTNPEFTQRAREANRDLGAMPLAPAPDVAPPPTAPATESNRR